MKDDRRSRGRSHFVYFVENGDRLLRSNALLSIDKNTAFMDIDRDRQDDERGNRRELTSLNEYPLRSHALLSIDGNLASIKQQPGSLLHSSKSGRKGITESTAVEDIYKPRRRKNKAQTSDFVPAATSKTTGSETGAPASTAQTRGAEQARPGKKAKMSKSLFETTRYSSPDFQIKNPHNPSHMLMPKVWDQKTSHNGRDNVLRRTSEGASTDGVVGEATEMVEVSPSSGASTRPGILPGVPLSCNSQALVWISLVKVSIYQESNFPLGWKS